MAPNWKPARGTVKTQRRARRRLSIRHERQEKLKVRLRDKGCRVPMCACYRHRYSLECSHARHKGMGGNVIGDRSTADRMVLVCRLRHRDSCVSIDHGTLRWEPTTPQGANGPITWLVDLDALENTIRIGPNPNWVVLAQENALNEWTVTPLQHARCLQLAKFTR